jgi:DNA-binding protein
MLPLAAMDTILKKAGAARIAESAKESLKVLLEKRIESITKLAATSAMHAGRKTIQESDIRKAIQQFS